MSEDRHGYAMRALGSSLARGGRQADEKHCFSCGRILHASAASCPSCGARQTKQMTDEPPVARQTLSFANAIFCYGCGKQMHAAAPSCPACGAPQRATSPQPQKDRTVAIVLAFLLGGIGAHKFYLGNPGWGIVYLLFCWTGIPAVVAMIEGLIYVSQTNEDFTRIHA